jgi:hypothetical protein
MTLSLEKQKRCRAKLEEFGAKREAYESLDIKKLQAELTQALAHHSTQHQL